MTHMKSVLPLLLAFSFNMLGHQPGFAATHQIFSGPQPRPPHNIHVSRTGSHSAQIAWDSIDGAAYEFRFRALNSAVWTYAEPVQINRIDLSGLSARTKYEFQVRAFVDDAASDWSTSHTFESKLLPTGPNMLIVYLDDSRYDCFGATGAPDYISTPAIDRIANEGANFKYCFPALSLCEPSRASIMTGLYPHHSGVIDNDYQPDFDKQTIAPILEAAGYHVGFVGKYGFKKFPNPGFEYYCESSSDPYWNGKYDYNGQNNIIIPGHKTTVFTEKAFEFLQSVPAGEKWVLFFAHKAPHVPLTPRLEESNLLDGVDIPIPPNYYTPYAVNAPSHYNECNHEKYADTEEDFKQDYRDYHELNAGVEWSMDTLLQYLEMNGLTDSTLIMFTSDNGLLIGEHFLAGKELALEESIRVPMFIRYPKWFPPGTLVDSAMVMNIDIAPTMIDAAGLPDTFGMDGTSMRRFYDGSAERKELFYEYFHRETCNPTFTAIRDFKYKYVQNGCTTSADEFYDLTIDSLENYNLINYEAYFDLIEEYRTKLEALKIQWDYINLSDSLIDCKLDSVDSTAVDSTIIIGIEPPIENSFRPGQLNVYPNPASDLLTVTLNIFTGNCEITVTDALSRIMFYEAEIESRELEVVRKINVRAYPPGYYLLTVRCNGLSASIPFVKHE
jgi:N-acetylglucosamine-6-sulfatase